MTFTCSVCMQTFKAHPSAHRVVCSPKCSAVRQSIMKRGIVPVVANRARYRRQRIESRATIHRQFGELSVREIELVRAVYWKAYNIGYQRALKREPRRKAA